MRDNAMKAGANHFHLADIGYFCKTATVDYFWYVSGWPEELHLDTISSSSDLLALFSRGSTAPCEQGSQGLSSSFTPGAAKCQNKVGFVSQGFILYSADQKAKITFIIRSRKVVKIKNKSKYMTWTHFCSRFLSFMAHYSHSCLLLF